MRSRRRPRAPRRRTAHAARAWAPSRAGARGPTARRASPPASRGEPGRRPPPGPAARPCALLPARTIADLVPRNPGSATAKTGRGGAMIRGLALVTLLGLTTVTAQEEEPPTV